MCPFTENHSQVIRISIDLLHEAVVVKRKINLKVIVQGKMEESIS